jgi:hypothetical protein
MIYVDTHRPLWTPIGTATRFFLTTLLLGIPTALLVSLVTAGISDQLTVPDVMRAYGDRLCQAIVVIAVAKLFLEATIFVALRQFQHTPRKRSALLLTGELSMVTLRRYFFGLVGGVVMPLVLRGESVLDPDGYQPLFIVTAVILMHGLLTAGELHERFLFFAASVAPRMPGAPAA